MQIRQWLSKLYSGSGHREERMALEYLLEIYVKSFGKGDMMKALSALFEFCRSEWNKMDRARKLIVLFGIYLFFCPPLVGYFSHTHIPELK